MDVDDDDDDGDGDDDDDDDAFPFFEGEFPSLLIWLTFYDLYVWHSEIVFVSCTMCMPVLNWTSF